MLDGMYWQHNNVVDYGDCHLRGTVFHDGTMPE